MVVAGGAAAFPYNRRQGDDVDYFTVAGDAEHTLAAIRDLLSQLYPVMTDQGIYGSVQQVAIPGLISLAPVRRIPRWRQNANGPALMTKTQIIMRAYESVSELLHGFDLGASSVAFDGYRVYLTTAGATAQITRTVIVEPRNRSTTYEARLARYFTKKGYGIVFPHLGEFSPASPIVRLPHLTLHIDAIDKGYLVGHPEVSGSDIPRSDYEHGDVNPREDIGVWGALHAATNINLAYINSGGGKVPIKWVTGENFDDEENEWIGAWFNSTSWLDPGGPTFGQLFSNVAVEGALRDAGRCVVQRGVVNLNALVEFYGLPHETAAAFALQYALQSAGHVRLDVRPVIDELAEAVRLQYRAVEDSPIEWIITHEPGRQFTGSLDPRMSTPEEWYGKYAAKGPSPRALVSVAPAGKEEETEGIDEADKCPLCWEACGKANVATLACGHRFHFLPNEDCEGVIRLKERGKIKCPMCRSSHETKRETLAANAADAPIARVPFVFTRPEDAAEDTGDAAEGGGGAPAAE